MYRTISQWPLLTNASGKCLYCILFLHTIPKTFDVWIAPHLKCPFLILTATQELIALFMPTMIRSVMYIRISWCFSSFMKIAMNQLNVVYCNSLHKVIFSGSFFTHEPLYSDMHRYFFKFFIWNSFYKYIGQQASENKLWYNCDKASSKVSTVKLPSTLRKTSLRPHLATANPDDVVLIRVDHHVHDFGLQTFWLLIELCIHVVRFHMSNHPDIYILYWKLAWINEEISWG